MRIRSRKTATGGPALSVKMHDPHYDAGGQSVAMAEESGRTLVCSVLFTDIVAYSKKTVADQYEIKRLFNGMVAGALELLKRRDRVIMDTGDGAAIVFLGDPEDALVVGVVLREHRAKLPMRLGINLGPVKLISDLNDQVNVIGDGINVAQRIMSFAEEGQLLVSASYHDVVSRQSAEYANLFVREGRRQDKHERGYEVYSVSDELRMQAAESLTDDEPPKLVVSGVYRAPDEPASAPPRSVHEPAKVLDAGQNMMISGSSRGSVKEALDRLVLQGATVISPISAVGSKWLAACTYPEAPSGIKVDEFGLTRIVSGRNHLAVADKVAEIIALGGRLRGEVEQIDGVWTAVCDV
jgi:class 3 adenylate cyclase